MKGIDETFKKMLTNGSVTEADIAAYGIIANPMEWNPRLEINPFVMDLDNLKIWYEFCCQAYRKRLCAMWNFPFEESWWMADKIGSGLFLADWWCPLSMEELRYIVENNVTEESWLEYCAFLEREINADRKPRINFFSWMKGCRPEMLKDNE